MTINELIEALEEYREDFGGDTPVRLMTQENYPFENSIDAVISLEEINDTDAEDEKPGFQPAGRWGYNGGDRPEQVIYLLEGSQLGYGTKAAWTAAGG